MCVQYLSQYLNNKKLVKKFWVHNIIMKLIYSSGGKSRQMENFHKLTHLPYFHKPPSEPELLGLQNKSKDGVGGYHVHFCMGMEWGMEKWFSEHPVEGQLSVFHHVLFQRHQ